MPRWKGRKEATIELSRHRTPTDDLPDGHDVPIADTTGRLFQTEGGYALSFDEGGCSYIYEAVNVSRSEFRSFIANLSPAGNEFRATWPQPTLDAYRRACKSEGPPQTSDGPEAVVRGFFDEVVGTAIHKIAEEPEERGHGGRFYVVESTTGLDFDVLLSAHLTGCWSVTHVHAPGAPATWPLSVSIGNESPDLALVGGGSPPGSVSKVIEIGYGGRVHRGEAAAGGVLRTELPFSHNRSGYILVRYLDTDGDLQGFLATALPPGDFAAG